MGKRKDSAIAVTPGGKCPPLALPGATHGKAEASQAGSYAGRPDALILCKGSREDQVGLIHGWQSANLHFGKRRKLRASRETELMQTFPVHLVTAWIGHTPLIAQKHYLQVIDADFTRTAKSGAGTAKSGAA